MKTITGPNLTIESGQTVSQQEYQRVTYERLVGRLPDSHREVVRRMEKKRPHVDLAPQCWRGYLVAEHDRRAMVGFGQALYSRQSEHDAGRNWFEEPAWTTLESTHDAFSSHTVDLCYALAASIDQSCHIIRRPFIKPIAGILRMQAGFSMIPSRQGRDLRWLYCLEADGDVSIYFPWFRRTQKLEHGDIVAYPASASPGITPVKAGCAWLMLSHEPAERYIRSAIYIERGHGRPTQSHRADSGNRAT